MRSIKDIPVSVEAFAAYLDGNLPQEEMKRIGCVIEKDDLLRAIVDTSDSIDSVIEEETDSYELPNIEDIHIPDPSTDAIESLDDDSTTILDENIEVFLSEESLHSFEGGDSFHQERDSLQTNDFKMHTAMKDMKTFGYEPNYELDTFDPNIYQGYCNTCAIRSQEIILRDYGIMIPQEDLMRYAEQKGWFNTDPEEGGTDPETVGNILDDCGVETTRTQDATIYDIIAELRAGHRIIVGVDAKELWLKKEPNLIKRLFGNIVNHVNDNVQDYLDMEGATHALIVAGVNVNPTDPSDIHVTLIDPGTGEMCVEYSFKEFEKAWEDSHHRMIATKSAAPFQYNYETHQMEPSNFSTDYIPAKAVLPEDLSNAFAPLPESFYELYDSEPTYSEDSPIPFEDERSDIDFGPDNDATYSESEGASPHYNDNSDQDDSSLENVSLLDSDSDGDELDGSYREEGDDRSNAIEPENDLSTDMEMDEASDCLLHSIDDNDGNDNNE